MLESRKVLQTLKKCLKATLIHIPMLWVGIESIGVILVDGFHRDEIGGWISWVDRNMVESNIKYLANLSDRYM